MSDSGAICVGVSDSSGAIYNEQGIPVEKISQWKNTGQSIINADEYGKIMTNEELLEKECDILVLAALDNQVHRDNAHNIQADIILELANGPTTLDADQILNKRGISVIPDILANAGGVTVSYFEWVQNISGYYWTDHEIDQRLKMIMDQATESIIVYASEHTQTLREAAFSIALSRIVRAMELRGGLDNS